MEGLVARIAPMFDKERSLLRWVALRGAFAQLYISTVDSTSQMIPFSPVVETAMGVRSVAAPEAAGPAIEVAPEWASRLSEDQHHAVTGVFAALAARLFDYGRYSRLSVDEVNQDPKCWLNDAMALDFIAWSAVALLRTGQAEGFLHAPSQMRWSSPAGIPIRCGEKLSGTGMGLTGPNGPGRATARKQRRGCARQVRSRPAWRRPDLPAQPAQSARPGRGRADPGRMEPRAARRGPGPMAGGNGAV